MRTPSSSLILWMSLAAGLSAGEVTVEFQPVVVRPGDTLWAIAQKYLKDPRRWDEILKHNQLPSSDPAVALPGMTLRIPITLIKDELRSANLIYKLNKVEYRRKDTADWKPAPDNMDLFRSDSLRTLEKSGARVRFQKTDLLELSANSMAVIKPANKDFDLELKSAGTFYTTSGARVMTPTTKITPKTKDTEYAATVRDDLSTLVEVRKGNAAVEAEGRVVDVLAGMSSNIKPGLPPSLPTKIANLPDFEARIGQLRAGLSPSKALAAVSSNLKPGAGDSSAPDIRAIRGEVDNLSIGEPISGYRVQFSPTKDFSQPAFDKKFEVDDKMRASDIRVSPGRYWVRIALIDLLGSEGRFAEPKYYSFSNTGLVLVDKVKN